MLIANSLVAVAAVKLPSPLYVTVTVYLPSVKPDTVMFALPFTIVAV